MNTHHKKKIKSLVDQLYAEKDTPFSNKKNWLGIQEAIIKEITVIESRVRKYNSKIKVQKASISDPNKKLTKEEAKIVKGRIEKYKKKTEYYHNLIHSYKSIGDSIAFIFIDKFDLRPQNFKDSPGFISCKKGTKLERRCLRKTFELGGIAILNDITHTLKYFDLTIVFDYDVWIPIEIKSGANRTQRDIRQSENAKKLLDYLFNDIPTDLYKSGGEMIREAYKVPYKDHTAKLHELIEIARTSKAVIIEEMEPGLFYFIATDNHSNFNEDILSTLEIEKPLFFSINEYKYNQLGLTPLVLSLGNSNNYVDFLLGKLVIFVLVDFKRIELLAERWGYIVNCIKEENYIFECCLISNPEVKIKVSHHLYSRLCIEFLSLAPFIENMLYLSDKIVDKQTSVAS